jgi:hypothetical protein
MTDDRKTFTAHVPLMRPLGVEVTSTMVEDVWDMFVKPGGEEAQSGEMRVLMAILRSVRNGLKAVEDGKPITP